MEEARRCPHCMAENTPDAAVCTRCGAGMDAQNAPHQLLVGALLAGRYRVGCCIGEGGFGITYAGWDETLDMKVAVKEYYPAGNVNRYNTQSLSVEPTNAESGAFFRARPHALSGRGADAGEICVLGEHRRRARLLF